MTQASPDWDKIGRYLAGESPPEEAAAMRRWLEDHPSDAGMIAALDAATKGAAPKQAIDVEAALRRVKTRARASTRNSPARFVAFTSRFETLAAAAAILLVAGVFLFRRAGTSDSTPDISRIYATVVGQIDSVTLADGSRIILGPGSRLVVRDRDVTLTGEAHFTVVHDAARPFTVRAGTAVIRDVGTKFSVHSDSAEPVRVVVSEGAVQLAHSTDSVLLRPGDVGVVAAGGRVQANRGAATDDDIAWTRGHLVFRNATLTDVAADLRRWYGVEVHVTDSALLNRHYTGTFVGESSNRVLAIIAMTLRVRAERHGDSVFFKAALQDR